MNLSTAKYATATTRKTVIARSSVFEECPRYKADGKGDDDDPHRLRLEPENRQHGLRHLHDEPGTGCVGDRDPVHVAAADFLEQGHAAYLAANQC
jgi:hypothetical protein